MFEIKIISVKFYKFSNKSAILQRKEELFDLLCMKNTCKDLKTDIRSYPII